MEGEYLSLDTAKKIAEKGKEIERLNNIIKEKDKDFELLRKAQLKKCQEYENLEKLNNANYQSFIEVNNIINELEKRLYERWLEWKDSECESNFCMACEDKSILTMIKELKGSDKE